MVVEFPDEKSVEVVSSAWVKRVPGGHVCLWPQVKSQALRRMVQQHSVPASEKSTECFCVVKYVTDDYQKAQEKAKILEIESDIDTDHDKRNRKKNSKYLEYKQFSGSENTSGDEIPVENLESFKKNAERNKNKSRMVFNKQPNETQTQPDVSQSSSSFNRQNNLNVAQPSSSSVSSKSGNEGLVIEKVFKKLEIMSKELKVIRTLIVGHFKVDIIPTDNEYLGDLPAQEIARLEKLEKDLQEKEEAFSSVCQALAIVGGKDYVENCRRVLGKLVGNNLALQHNWRGRNEKQPFSQYTNIVKMIIGVVRQNPFCKNTTQKQIEDVIKIWLRSAGDRDGGRVKRAQKKNGAEALE